MHLERRIVDQDVDFAKRRENLLNRPETEFPIGNVAGNGDTPTALILDRPYNGGGILRLVLEMNDRHIGTLTREQHGDGPAYAGIAAGNESDFALKLAGALPERRIVHRLEGKALLNARFCHRFGTERWLWIGSSTSLHRSLHFHARPRLIGDADLLLNLALQCRNIITI
jgi:hypothetical protein